MSSAVTVEPRLGGSIARAWMVRFLVGCVFALAVFTVCASSAHAAFSVTGWQLAPSNTQAGGHANVTMKVNADAASADQTSDDIRDVTFDLPSGLLVNPQAITTPCSNSSFASDACQPATQIGTISVKHRISGTTTTSLGSVYALTPDDTSVLKLGFVVRPSKYQRLFFSSSSVTGLTTVRSGLGASYGLSIRVPSIPRTVRTSIGTQVNMTIAELSITLGARTGSTQTGRYFTYNPTSCVNAVGTAAVTSYRSVTVTRSSSFLPTNCGEVQMSPDFALTNTNKRAGEPTRLIAELWMPTEEQTIQQSHIQSVSATLPTGTTLNLANLNSVPELCSDAQLAAASCPLASRIGFAGVNVPFLPSSMAGDIYLTSRSEGVGFGIVVWGPRGTIAIFRGSAAPAESGGPAIVATFSDLPQVPFTSATLDFGIPLVNNPSTQCSGAVSWADITGYSGSRSIIGSLYEVTDCIVPPQTYFANAVPTLTRDNTPSFSFSSDIAGATFQCSLDATVFSDCSNPYTAATLTDGLHELRVRAVNSGVVDASPASASFTVDTIAPAITITSPAEGEILSSDSGNFEFTTEAGATVFCRIDSGGFVPCASPFSFSGLADGDHEFVVFARDAASNFRVAERVFAVAAVQPPVVTITSPANSTQLALDEFNVGFSATSPNGTPITSYQCTVVVESANYTVTDRACVNGELFEGFSTGQEYALTVTATDANGQVGSAVSRFVAGIRRPSAPSLKDAPSSAKITDRTPTFEIEYGDPLYPVAEFDCSFGVFGGPTQFAPCGDSSQSNVYQVSDPLANGRYTFKIRTRASGQTSSTTTMSFTVADWDATYSVTPSTTDAGAHPDLDVNIKPAAGQLRSMDMRLPTGMIGSLTAFPRCAAENVATANCAPETQVGSIDVDIKINGLSFVVPTVGMAYLTEAQAPGDIAGLTLLVKTPIEPFSDVVIPLRVQLTDNGQRMRVFSDSIPTETWNKSEEMFNDFYVIDFTLSLTGSQGSPFPFMTNPSSCTASQFATDFGDTELQRTPILNVPFTATNCGALPFSPTTQQAFSSLVANTTTNVVTNFALPQGSSSIKNLKVTEPPSLGPEYTAFGRSADRCPGGAASTNTLFDPTNCPAASKVGRMELISPLLPDPLSGDVYLVNKTPLPWFGVHLTGPGIDVRLTGKTDLVQVDPDCDPSTGSCMQQIVVEFDNAPDVQVTNIDFNLNSGPRPRPGTLAPLPGELLLIPEPGAEECLPEGDVITRATSHSGVVTELIQPLTFEGC